MLLAIAIYDIQSSDTNNFKLLKAGSRKGFFSNNPLDNIKTIEKNILPQLLAGKVRNDITYAENDGEHYYLQTIQNTSIHMLIISLRTLDRIQVRNLFNNIAHIHIHNGTTKLTLDDIILNPINYTVKNVQIIETQKTLDDTKEIMKDNINKVLLRGENIDVLAKRTEQLQIDSFKLKERAKEMNACCRIL